MVLSRRPARQVLAKRSGRKALQAVSQVVRRPAPMESGVKMMRKPANAESNVLRKPVASATKVIQFFGEEKGSSTQGGYPARSEGTRCCTAHRVDCNGCEAWQQTETGSRGEWSSDNR